DLIAFLQPLARTLHAVLVVVDVGSRSKLHFLDRDHDLFLLRFVCLFLLLVLKLAKVDNFANGRLGIRCDLDKIHSLLARAPDRIASFQHTELFTVVAHHAHLRHANALVNSNNWSAAEIWPTAAS